MKKQNTRPNPKGSKANKHLLLPLGKGFLLLLIFLLPLGTGLLFSQGIAINTTGAPTNATAILDVSATNLGLLIPRMTLCQRTTPSCAGGLLNAAGDFLSGVAAQGLLVYQTDGTQGFYWLQIVS